MGLVTKIFAWIGHPSNSEGDVTEWAAGLILILILAFLWSTVVRQILPE